MKKLSELFNICANTAPYIEVGDRVTYAFVEENDELYIYFQGSNGIADWVRNFLFPAKPYKDMEIPYRVHRGFLAAWKEVEDIVIAKIADPKYRRIIVVGYSHGGALASFCHECVWFHRPDLRESGLYGFGFEAPRMYADWTVKPELRERWKNFYVIRTNNDIVTHCPPFIFRFTHTGELIKVRGDTALVDGRLPKCVKSHFPQVVMDALLHYEAGEEK